MLGNFTQPLFALIGHPTGSVKNAFVEKFPAFIGIKSSAREKLLKVEEEIR